MTVVIWKVERHALRLQHQVMPLILLPTVRLLTEALGVAGHLHIGHYAQNVRSVFQLELMPRALRNLNHKNVSGINYFTH